MSGRLLYLIQFMWWRGLTVMAATDNGVLVSISENNMLQVSTISFNNLITSNREGVGDE